MSVGPLVGCKCFQVMVTSNECLKLCISLFNTRPNSVVLLVSKLVQMCVYVCIYVCVFVDVCALIHDRRV